MKVVFCCSEVVPFAKTGGMADVCGALPLALEKLGIDVSIIMPKYKTIDESKYRLMRLNEEVSTVQIGKNIAVYFVGRGNYFQRDGLYGDQKGDYPDNLGRFQFFCEKSLALLKEFSIQTNIVHCHDWQTGLIPAYLKSRYRSDPFFKNVKSILTIHNLAYQGVFSGKEFPKLKLPSEFFTPQGFEFYNQVNFLKGGLLFSDVNTTVSPTYAKEIRTREQGCGLEGVINQRKDAVIGILNGLDYSIWNPAQDESLEGNFSPESMAADKTLNKKKLVKDLGLVSSDAPLLGFVGRLSHQKGLDLIQKVFSDLSELDVQIVFLGVGEEKYHRLLSEAAQKYPEKIAVRLEFDEAMAHRIYGSCDFFLMPSLYEPCGLSQMISLRYGTIPIVHQTGGLADTIQAFDPKTQAGSGFVFSKYTEGEFLKAIKEGIEVFQKKDLWEGLVRKAVTYDFSWEKSARQYQALYQQC